ncbi:MAG: hypothetical protein ACRCZF_26635, partial [Gemmataceae bacterium]
MFPMLVYQDAEQFTTLSEPEQEFQRALLTALREGASQLEFRFGDGWMLTYQRVEGRDWEVLTPSDELQEELRPLIRRVARLVKPERPELTFSGIPAGSQIVSPEIGWLTFHIGEKWLDL